MTERVTAPSMPSDADLGELRTLARSIFQKPASEALNVQQTAIPFDEALWKTLVASGLTLLSTPERAGGSGAGIAEAAVVASVAGEYAAPVPVAETDLLAAWLLDLADLDVPTGPLSSGTGAVSISDGPGGVLIVCGTIDRVSWGREADAIVVLGRADDRDAVFLIPSHRCTITEGYNLAHEPRDCVTFHVELPPESVVTVGEEVALEWVLRGALARTAQTCGALETALTLTIGHATERMQFGRQLGKFQAVQHMIARAAGEVSVARAASDVAIRAAVHDGALESASGTGRCDRQGTGRARVRCGQQGLPSSARRHRVHARPPTAAFHVAQPRLAKRVRRRAPLGAADRPARPRGGWRRHVGADRNWLPCFRGLTQRPRIGINR